MEKRIEIVLSLFNGMNTGRIALDNCGIEVGKYYSSEIKPYAIKLTQHHHPDTMQLGDVMNWRNWDIDWSKVGLILSGSPCQDLSIAGKRAGINGEKSSLFWVFIDILNHIKSFNPNVLFFQENVGSAPKKDIGIMSRAMGVYPVRINSSLVTAQLRDRYYWSNIRTRQLMFDIITDIPKPKDRKIFLKDIISDGFVYRTKATAILESECRAEKNETLKKRYDKGMRNAVFYENGIRHLNKNELCLLQGFPKNHCEILDRNKSASLLGDGWTLPIVEHFFSFIKF